MNQQLIKAERINSKITIETIFKNGKSVFSFPYKVVWNTEVADENKPAVEILLSVGKKRFKKAVDRNHIKRLIRETFRTNKHILWDYCEVNNLRLQIALVYVDKEIGDFQTHNKAFLKIIDKLIAKQDKRTEELLVNGVGKW